MKVNDTVKMNCDCHLWKRGSIGRIVKIKIEYDTDIYCLICFDKTCTEMHNRKGHAFWAHSSEFELYQQPVLMKVE